MRGWRYDSYRHSLAAKGIKTRLSFASEATRPGNDYTGGTGWTPYEGSQRVDVDYGKNIFYEYAKIKPKPRPKPRSRPRPAAILQPLPVSPSQTIFVGQPNINVGQPEITFEQPQREGSLFPVDIEREQMAKRAEAMMLDSSAFSKELALEQAAALDELKKAAKVEEARERLERVLAGDRQAAYAGKKCAERYKDKKTGKIVAEVYDDGKGELFVSQKELRKLEKEDRIVRVKK